MAIIFSDGFESNNFNAWDSTARAPTISNTVFREGHYSAHFNDINLVQQYCAKIMPGPPATTYTRLYVLFHSLPSNDGKLTPFLVTDDSGSNTVYRAYIGYYIATGLVWGIDCATTRFTEVAGSINADQWYCVEVRATAGAGNAIVDLYVDGIRLIHLTGETFTDTKNVYCGIIQADELTNELYIDAVVVNDSDYNGGLDIMVGVVTNDAVVMS